MTSDLLKPVCALLVYQNADDEIRQYAIPFGAKEFEVIEKAKLVAGKWLNSDEMPQEQVDILVYIDDLVYRGELSEFSVDFTKPLTTKMITEVVTCGWAG